MHIHPAHVDVPASAGRVDSELHYDPEINANMHVVLHGAKHLTLWLPNASGLARWPLTAKSGERFYLRVVWPSRALSSRG